MVVLLCIIIISYLITLLWEFGIMPYILVRHRAGALPWSRAHFLFLTPSKLKHLCSANHRPGYFSNLAFDWLSIVWACSEQETENGPWSRCSTSVLDRQVDHCDFGLHLVTVQSYEYNICPLWLLSLTSGYTYELTHDGPPTSMK